jgi:UDP-N-acetylglucosamine:LPS N-acetylglucosamine transferase
MVMGEGGHTKQCLRLLELMGTADYRYSYVLVAGDEVTQAKLSASGAVYRVWRPGTIKSNPFLRLLLLPISAIQSAVVVARLRPDAVLSTGPGVAVPVCAAGKVFGARIIFVEDFCRVRGLSLTGRLMRSLADLYFVQWEDLRPAVPRAVYAGRVY